MNHQAKSFESSFHTLNFLRPRLAQVLVATLLSLLFCASSALANFARVGALTFNPGENNLRCAVIDPAGGFAYFGNLTGPAMVVKVRLSDFTRVGVLTLNPGENGLNSAVIDPTAGFAYFGVQQSPGVIVKVRLSDFTRVGTLSLNNPLTTPFESAVIDTAGGFAYFGTDTSPGVVVKVRLSDFTLAGSLTLNSGENRLQSAAIDPAGGFAYFDTLTSPGNVVKIRLSNFTRVGALTLNSGEDQLGSVAIDPAGGFAYVGTGTSPAGKVVKVRLSDFTRVGALTLNFGESFLASAVIDPAAGFLYFGSNGFPGQVVRVRLSDFTRVASVAGDSGENLFSSAVIDPAAGFAYFGAQTSPGIVVKVDISPPPPPTISINDVSITEGDIGTKALNFTVTLSAASNLPVTANFATANGTASAPTDYLAANGTLTFNPGDTTKTVGVSIVGNTKFEPDKTFTLTLSTPVNATINKATGTGTILNDDAQGGFISFGPSSYTVNEADGFVTLTVNRTNDVSRAATVDYTTDDTGAPANCATVNGLASSRCDFTTAIGTLKFAAGETSKTITVLVNRDSYAEGPEMFLVFLSNPTGGAMTIVPGEAAVTINDGPVTPPPANLIDDPSFFVRQHYNDFLNREPDAAGLQFWTNQISSCGADAQCIDGKRVNVSAGFFLSIEFQDTGGTAYLTNKAAFGAVPIYSRFEGDSQALGQGYIFGAVGAAAVIEANKVAYYNNFLNRPEFTANYGLVSNGQYVDALITNTGVAFTQAERDALVNGLNNSTETRATVLRKITEKASYRQAEMNRMFVLMEYFGYLRRNPSDPPDNNLNGFNFWLNKLNQFNGDFIQAEMVKAFIVSAEYRHRFGP